jgi:hypothetical protein
MYDYSGKNTQIFFWGGGEYNKLEDQIVIRRSDKLTFFSLSHERSNLSNKWASLDTVWGVGEDI